MVGRKSSQRFSVRYISDGLCGDDGIAHLARIWPSDDRRAQKLEHRSANSRRRAASAHVQTRHPHDGWLADRMFGNHLDVVMGAAVESLRLDYGSGDTRIRRGWFRRRLSEVGEATQSRSDWPSKAGVSVHHRVRSLGRVIYFDPLFADKVFMEHQHSILQRNGGAEWHQYDSVGSLPRADYHRAARLDERGESDRRARRTRDQRDFHRDDSVDCLYLFEQRRALGR